MYSDSLEHAVQPWMLAEPQRCEAFNVLSLQLCIATAKKTHSSDEWSPSERKVTESTNQRQSRCSNVQRAQLAQLGTRLMSGGCKMSLGKLYTEQAGGLGTSKQLQLIVLQLMSARR